MGSFYSSCSVSGMTLSHQKTSILLLTPNAELSEHLDMIVCNDGCQAFFSPFAFPIHGVYDDYGYITDIKRDKNVEMLEEYFGVDIQSILRGIGKRDTPKDIKNIDIYEKLGMTYFRTEVLEYLEKGWDQYSLKNPEQYSDDEFAQKLVKVLDKSNQISDEEFAKILTKKLKGNITDEERELMYNYIQSHAKTERTYISSYKVNTFKNLPLNMDFKEYVLKQYTMITRLGFELRRTLMPSEYGGQDNNWAYLYKFNDFVNDLLIEDIKYSYDGNGTDGEEEEILRMHQAVLRNRKINSIL
jgi:hypothetical protein